MTTRAVGALDAITVRWTAFRSFAGLLAGGEQGHDAEPVETSYRPSIYPGRYAAAEEVAELRQLADAYDEAQEARGDARRAHRGDPCWWRPATAEELAGLEVERPRRRRRRSAQQALPLGGAQ